MIGLIRSDLSAKCPSGESIKVIFLARHGHGKSFTSPISFTFRTDMVSGKHNIIHEQYATWEEVSFCSVLTRAPTSSLQKLSIDTGELYTIYIISTA
jgi:hypothetical protein